MRVNLPVSAVEFPFPPGETLVSTTDLKGRITYCNPSFVAVSGYNRDELLGQPHNLIRHPDMPEEAFRDMWATISSGQPWSAPVKNRRKDGSHYWVMANVTPLVNAGGPIGYMSVRTEPTREQVRAAEALYATMREEKEQGRLVHCLQGGELQARTASATLLRRLQLGIAARVALGAGAAAAAGAAGTGFALGAPGLPVLLAAGVAGLGAAVAAGFGVQRLAVHPLHGMLNTANRMAAGDLTQTIAAQGSGPVARLTRALSQLNVNLRSIVRDARNEVENMAHATQEIASGNQDLSSRTESQAANLQQTAASMEQITSTVRSSVGAAQTAAQLAERARAVTADGNAAIGEVNQTMNVISESSKRIAEIIGVIDAIAFQTNILALNAAVEAARAGEQGRGFAVVAGEVRALAGRTTNAAREIKQLIQESGNRVEAGNRVAENARQTISGALDTVRKVSEAIAEISDGAQQQLTGISQVNEAVSQMDGLTQQNAALVEEIAAAAMQLRGQSATVAEAVRVFHLDTAGHQAQPDAVALRRAAKASVAEPAAA